MSSFSDYTGASADFDYQALAALDGKVIKSRCQSLRQKFQRLTLLPNAHEEWLFRTYAAVKLILAATVMLSSAKYAIARALRIVEPYLVYYALFNTSRALVLVLPEQGWENGRLLDESSHEKIRNLVSDQLRYYSKTAAANYKDIAERALVARELFSYKFPAEGLKGPIANSSVGYDEVTEVCRYVAEVAELNSECLEAAFQKLGRPFGDFSDMPLRRFWEYEHRLLRGPLEDDEDYYRLGRALTHLGRPVSLWVTATEGLVEDFFGAWNFDETGTDQYTPSMDDWTIIFPFF